MTQLLGKFTVDSGTYFEEVLLIEKGGNHCQIIKNPGDVLFSGYTLEGEVVFEEKAETFKKLADLAGWKFTRVR